MNKEIQIVVLDYRDGKPKAYESPDVIGFEFDEEDLVVHFDAERCDQDEIHHPAASVVDISVTHSHTE